MKNLTTIICTCIFLLAFGCKSTKINQKKALGIPDTETASKTQDAKLVDTNKKAKYKAVSFLDKTKQFKFIDTITGNVKSAFNIDEKNPYMLEYSKYTKGEPKNYFYFPEKISIDKFISPDKRAIYERNVSNAIVDRAYTTSYYYNNDYWALAAYTLALMGDDILLGCKSHIDIYDRNGNKTAQIIDDVLNVNNATITNDGKYVCYTYGDNDEYGNLVLNGYKIYDVNSNAVLNEEIFPVNYYNFSTSIQAKRLFVQMLKEGLIQCYIVFDFNKKVKYTYDYFPDKDKLLKTVEEYGLVFQDRNGIVSTVYYDKDFKTEKILK
jgi:hypothetical protein